MTDTRAEQVERPWIAHDGGPMPVPDLPEVEIRLRNGSTECRHMGACDWGSSTEEPETDIIAYRIVEPSDGR